MSTFMIDAQLQISNQQGGEISTHPIALMSEYKCRTSGYLEIYYG